MEVKNKKVTVLGAARSGVSVARLLKMKGANILVSDNAAAEKMHLAARELTELSIEFEVGSHSPRVFNSDLVVLSPGIPVASEIVQKILERKIPVLSEVEVAYWFNKSNIIGITGSNGKTTTTLLAGEMLKTKNPNAVVAGNVGYAFSEQVNRTKKNEWSVIELSSFQLETIDEFKPNIAVVLNFSPNHLDRYDSYEHYLKAKWRITKNLTNEDYCIYNADDSKVSEWAEKLNCNKRSFSTRNVNPNGAGIDDENLYILGNPLISLREIGLRGMHNYQNAMAASLAADIAGIDHSLIASVLKSFKSVEHRLEKVREIDGISFINDSKATTVESLKVALKSFNRPVILIAGGKDKGSDFSELNELVDKHAKHLVLIGTAADKMKKTWENIKPITISKSLKEAVEIAFKTARKNDVVLLSPACASFDMFKDYEDRGRKFKEIVNEL